MKMHCVCLCFLSLITQSPFAQHKIFVSKHKHERTANNFPTFDKYLLLEPTLDTTINVSVADFNGDRHLDILLVEGGHWPIIDRILLGKGSGGIKKAYNLGTIPDRSYSGSVADFNGDGFPDIAISNESPDKKLVYFNDGKGNFAVGSAYGVPDWQTRNSSVADINNDGLADLIVANRGDGGEPTANFVCLNRGKGKFDSACAAFAPYSATTITPADFNKDGFIDLVVPHRDSGQSYIYLGNPKFTFSDAHRILFGPPDATIRLSAVADFNGDDLLDIVAIDENKGVTIYWGQKDQTFSEGTLLADAKTVPYALAIADLNKDGKPDIIVGHEHAPSTVFYNNGTGGIFKPVSFGDSQGIVFGFAVGDFDEDGVLDIATARLGAASVLYFGNIK